MPNWIVVIILGIVEGLTEFLPVSSTGHLLIAEHWLASHQSDLFNIVIQIGAVLAVIPLFWQRIEMLMRWNEPASRVLNLKIFVAFVITCIGGLVLKKLGLKLPEAVQPIAIALIIGGIIFIVVEAVGGLRTYQHVLDYSLSRRPSPVLRVRVPRSCWR